MASGACSLPTPAESVEPDSSAAEPGRHAKSMTTQAAVKALCRSQGGDVNLMIAASGRDRTSKRRGSGQGATPNQAGFLASNVNATRASRGRQPSKKNLVRQAP